MKSWIYTASINTLFLVVNIKIGTVVKSQSSSKTILTVVDSIGTRRRTIHKRFLLSQQNEGSFWYDFLSWIRWMRQAYDKPTKWPRNIYPRAFVVCMRSVDRTRRDSCCNRGVSVSHAIIVTKKSVQIVAYESKHYLPWQKIYPFDSINIT